MIKVEVAYATPLRQLIIEVSVLPNATISDAIIASGMLDEFADINWPKVAVGIFGRKVNLLTRLKANDRVEIYRPLIFDPKISRLRRKEKSKKTDI